MTTTTTPRSTTDVLSALSSLIRASRSVARQRQAQLGTAGTPLAILKALATQPAENRPGDLAVVTGVAPSVVSRALARLEEDGLVVRHPDEADARACHISLTPEGHSQLDAITDQYALLLGDALAELSDDDVERLPGLLHTLEQSLRRAGARLAPPRHTPLAPSLVDSQTSTPSTATNTTVHESL
ncbi:DNA-binding MarR family transcriptional regulator [Phycicoccus badiiscoriae]|uniref:DNA-binding MarR family transcriptional regulator n=1 Tax=Pedococcus badiiscoriae TaxID=642776 RepID=A0A852WCF8_9MICO|nr:MarR family transcriptional regulator [Pedococcus badiiscoriae]NYG06728.1 DNA-binding MarR family transcriptional regulator [Pedococcus badiiscoriae]